MYVRICHHPRLRKDRHNAWLHLRPAPLLTRIRLRTGARADRCKPMLAILPLQESGSVLLDRALELLPQFLVIREEVDAHVNVEVDLGRGPWLEDALFAGNIDDMSGKRLRESSLEVTRWPLVGQIGDDEGGISDFLLDA